MRKPLCLAFAIFAATGPAAASVERPVPTNDPPHVCMNDYPEAAVWDGAEGTAIVAFRIGTDGKVKDVTLSKSTGNDDLDAATLGCVGRWSYKPAMRDGIPIEVPWRAQVEWKMHGSVADMHPCARYHAVTASMLSGIDGITKVSFRIMPDGSVKNAEIVRSSGNSDLDQAALKCVGARHYNTARAVLPDNGAQKDALVDWRNDLGPAK